MYNEKVMDVFQHPQNVGEIENPDGIGTVGNETCGYIMQITLRIKDDVITDAKFKTFGCAAAIATSSTATEMIKGMTLDEALKVTNKKVIETREKTKKQLSAAGFECLDSQSNFIFAKHKSIPAEKLYLELKSRGILIRYFNKPRISDYVRITVGSPEQMQTFVKTAETIIKDVTA